MLLVDTSIWIDFLRSAASPIDQALQDKIREDQVRTCGIILTELYQGSRSQKELLDLENQLAVVPVLKEKTETFKAAGRMACMINRRGPKISTVDAIIAQVAIENQLPLWSLDKHFKLIAAHTPLQLFEINSH